MGIAIPAIYIGSNVDKFSRHVQDMSDTDNLLCTSSVASTSVDDHAGVVLEHNVEGLVEVE